MIEGKISDSWDEQKGLYKNLGPDRFTVKEITRDVLNMHAIAQNLRQKRFDVFFQALFFSKLFRMALCQ
jgi:hypothetical protein